MREAFVATLDRIGEPGKRVAVVVRLDLFGNSAGPKPGTWRWKPEKHVACAGFLFEVPWFSLEGFNRP
jgi:hypothetical protein